MSQPITPRPLRAAMLERVVPTPAEQQAAQDAGTALITAAQKALDASGVRGKATLQGSMAKGTWLRGGADFDLFLLVDPSVPAESLDSLAEAVGRKFLDDPKRRYAQHPYLMGTFQGHAVDLVPAYAVEAATEKMSAVDRTPFHTAWVHANISADQEAEVRLAKRWLKGIGAYGAQTATGGFSGYLVELLVAKHGTFDRLVDWLALDARPRTFTWGSPAPTPGEAVLVVADPVDPARNAAAAVQPDTLERAIRAARAFRYKPSEAFFFPKPAVAELATSREATVIATGQTWLGIRLDATAARLDIVFPQFQRASRTLCAALERAGFTTTRVQVLLEEPHHILIQWLGKGSPLPATRLHRGPVDTGKPNVAEFRAKYATHPDAASPVRVGADGRVELDLVVRHRTPSEWLAANLATALVGKHVHDALPTHKLWVRPSQADETWAPAVSEFILDRMPWER